MVAVSHPILSNYYNVIVFPVKGKYTLASYLGGGGEFIGYSELDGMLMSSHRL